MSWEANWHNNEIDGEWIWAQRKWREEGGKKLYRKIILWGYETQGGRASSFWKDPNTLMSPKGTQLYREWEETKRPFTREEVLKGKWEKHGDETGIYFNKQELLLLPDGTLREHDLGKPQPSWSGKWQLVNDGVLRLMINDYELDVVANKAGNKHSGINFVPYHAKPVTYFTMIHIPK